MFPLDELKQLDARVESAGDIGALRPVFERLEEIGRQHAGDFDVQLAVADVRQRLIEKGLAFKRWRTNGDAVEEDAAHSSIPSASIPFRKPADSLSGMSKKPPQPINVKRAISVGAGLGITAWLILFVVLVQIARNRNMPPAPKPVSANKPVSGSVPVDIATAPIGAKIRINGEEKCLSNCRINLLPGNYQVTAQLDGFNPGATGVTVVPGGPINVNLALVSQSQTVKLYTDLEGGRVLMDGQPAGELQDGQLIIDRVPNGKHTIRILGKMADASFGFEGESGKQPVVAGPIAANNILAVVVSSLADEARVQSSSQTPLNVRLNNQLMGDTGSLGLDLKYVPAGDQTLVIGEGAEQRKLVVAFGPMPTITAFLKSDVNTGTLVVTTGGEDDVSVFLNGKEYRRKTTRGELRIQTVGNLSVRVAKPGFQAESEQRIEVKKGEETKVAFKLRPLPQIASMQIRDGVPGTQILVGDRVVGRVGPDGNLSASNLAPGQQEIEARRDGFVPKRIQRTLRAGETLVINGSEMVLPAAVGTLHLTVNPADAAVTYRRADDPEAHPVRGGTLRLDPGTYIFTARAPNHVDRTERTTIAAGENRNLEIALTSEVKQAAAAPPKPVARPADWSGWSRDGGAYVRKGGNRVLVQPVNSPGTITFTAHLRKAGGLFRGGKLRWFLENEGGYSQFEVDKKKFTAKIPGGSSHTLEFGKESAVQDDEEGKAYSVQIEITPERIVHRMKVGSTWVTVNSQPNRGEADGKFGFVIPGNDEIAISDYRFTAK
jgi:hypothetical protein